MGQNQTDFASQDHPILTAPCKTKTTLTATIIDTHGWTRVQPPHSRRTAAQLQRLPLNIGFFPRLISDGPPPAAKTEEPLTARQRRCLSHDDSRKARQRRCLRHDGSRKARQRQCLTGACRSRPARPWRRLPNAEASGQRGREVIRAEGGAGGLRRAGGGTSWVLLDGLPAAMAAVGL